MGNKENRIRVFFFFLSVLALAVFLEASISVPNVVGKSQEEALTLLKKSGLQGKVILLRQSPQPAPPPIDRVYDQSPAAGARVKAGATVTIRIFRPLTILAPVKPRVFDRPKTPTIVYPPKVVDMKPPGPDLRIGGTASQNMGHLGYPVEVCLYKFGKDEITQAVDYEWILKDGGGGILGKDRRSFSPQELYAKDSGPTGQYEIAKHTFELPEFFKKTACRLELKIDPDNRLTEKDEANNTAAVAFGECRPLPQPADPGKGIDLVPEFDPSLLADPDAYGFRYIRLRVVNRGDAQLRKNFDYRVFIDLEGAPGITGQRSFSSADLPLNAGEAKVIDTGVWLKDQDFRSAKEITFILDTDYQLPEKDKWNNIASFPIGRGEESPESDPNAKPDLQISFNKIQVPSDWSCYSESALNNPNISGCALQINALISNSGAKSVSGSGGVEAELSILDAEGRETYITTAAADYGIAAGSNLLLDIKVSPLVHFMKACALKLKADPENRIAESREDNNDATIALPFCGHFPPLPDLRITNLTIDRTGEGDNANYILQANCENAGNGIGNPTFDIHWYMDGEKIGTVGYLTLTSFGPFPSPLSTFAVPFSIPARNLPPDKKTARVKVVIDSLGNFQEIDAANNVYEAELTLPRE